jgi:hypothetical protein
MSSKHQCNTWTSATKTWFWFSHNLCYSTYVTLNCSHWFGVLGSFITIMTFTCCKGVGSWGVLYCTAVERLQHCSENNLRNVHECHMHIYHHLSLHLQVHNVGLPHTKCGQNYLSCTKLCSTMHAFIISSVKSNVTFKGLWKTCSLFLRIPNVLYTLPCWTNTMVENFFLWQVFPYEWM